MDKATFLAESLVRDSHTGHVTYCLIKGQGQSLNLKFPVSATFTEYFVFTKRPRREVLSYFSYRRSKLKSRDVE